MPSVGHFLAVPAHRNSNDLYLHLYLHLHLYPRLYLYLHLYLHLHHAHALERVIAQVLAEAKTFSPFYWTHVHRYVLSGSVWCERTWNRPDTLRIQNN